MTCQDHEDLLTGYVDGELSDDQRREVENHLQECADCSRQLEEIVSIKEHLTMIEFKEPSEMELERYWGGVYNRLERGLGWILASAGAIILLSLGAIETLREMLGDQELSPYMKVGVIALVIGGVTLFVSVFRERLSVRKSDKYSREVEK